MPLSFKCLLMLLVITTSASAQDNASKFRSTTIADNSVIKKDVRTEVIAFDIAPLLMENNNASVFGFIGADYQRIRVKLISIIKNKDIPDQYMVFGKSMVKDNVCEFQGTLKLTSAYYINDPEFKDTKQGFILGDYLFYENPAQKHVGQFKGVFRTGFYIDPKGQIAIDDRMGGADGYANNEFVGTWTAYSGKPVKPCNWGQGRIPMSGDLDSGAGEFYPNDKYVTAGWLDYKKAFSGGTNAQEAKEAEKRERAEWWK